MRFSGHKYFSLLSFKDSISPIRIVFLTSLVILAFLTVYSYKSNIDLISKANSVNHTNVVKFELQNLSSEISDAETGSRAFYLSGIRGYLDDYYRAIKDAPASFNILDSLTRDNILQQNNMTRLKRLTREKFAYLKTAVDSSAQRKNNDSSALLSSREDLKEIREQVQIMMHEEDRLLFERTNNLQEAVSFAPSLNIWLAGFSILLLVFSYFKILNELEKSQALQKKILDSNIILESSNKELAQFAYVASHDLQEPLRKIQTFISRIRDTEPGLTAKGRDYFERVDRSAKRMQQLILDILAYSRVDKRDNKYEHTDLNRSLDRAKEQLEEFIKERHAVIRSEKLPVINGVRHQFDQVFVNLISNALKFAKPGEVSVVDITHHLVNGAAVNDRHADKNIDYHCIIIEDNGIGFDPQYADRIFKIFNRLNTKEEYDGNGIGLSIVKKIMEAHGGFVFATGERGKGAVFSLYLPA